jgi:hypothetical protein
MKPSIGMSHILGANEQRALQLNPCEDDPDAHLTLFSDGLVVSDTDRGKADGGARLPTSPTSAGSASTVFLRAGHPTAKGQRVSAKAVPTRVR